MATQIAATLSCIPAKQHRVHRPAHVPLLACTLPGGFTTGELPLLCSGGGRRRPALHSTGFQEGPIELEPELAGKEVVAC